MQNYRRLVTIAINSGSSTLAHYLGRHCLIYLAHPFS
jgi:hypothetical protein